MLKEALHRHAIRQSKDFGDDRIHTVGASEVGQCLRRIWFAKNERSPDPGYADRWGAKVRGTIYEEAWWVPALRAAYGERLLYAGRDQRTLYLDYLSATPDGLITGLEPTTLAHLGVPDIESDCIAVECKTTDPRTRLDQPKPEHRFQVITQLGMLRERTNHKPVWGLLSYTDASWWDEIPEFPIRFDEDVFMQAKARAATVMTAANPFELRPEGWIAGGRECESCPFSAACGTAQAAIVRTLKDIAAVPDREASVLAEKARLARRHRQQADAAAEEARRLEEEIKAELSRAGTRSVKFGGVAVTWSSVKGRPSTDWKALREAAEEAGVDTASFTTVGEPTDRLTITIKDQAEKDRAVKDHPIEDQPIKSLRAAKG